MQVIIQEEVWRALKRLRPGRVDSLQWELNASILDRLRALDPDKFKVLLAEYRAAFGYGEDE